MIHVGLMLAGDVPLGEIGELARHVEHVGFDSLWHADEKFYRDPFVALTTAALNTKRLLLGTCVTDPYSRHPALLAMAIGSLVDVAGGRVILGIGAGGSGFGAMGIARSKPAEALIEAVGTIREMLQGGQVERADGLFPARGATLSFPVRHPVPIYIAARGPKVLRAAGRVADGVILTPCATLSAVRYALACVGAGRVEAGRDRSKVLPVAKVDIGVAGGSSEVRRLAKERVALSLLNSHPNLQFVEAAGLDAPSGVFRQALALRDRAIERWADALVPEAYVDRLAIIGNPSDAARRIAEIAAGGVDHFILDPISAPGVSTLNDLVDQLAEHVLPEIRRGGGFDAGTL